MCRWYIMGLMTPDYEFVDIIRMLSKNFPHKEVSFKIDAGNLDNYLLTLSAYGLVALNDMLNALE